MPHDDELEVGPNADSCPAERKVNPGILQALDKLAVIEQLRYPAYNSYEWPMQDFHDGWLNSLREKITTGPNKLFAPTYEMLAAQHTRQRADIFRLIERIERRVVGLTADLREHADDRAQGALDTLADLLPELYATYGGDEVEDGQRLGRLLNRELGARKAAQEGRNTEDV